MVLWSVEQILMFNGGGNYLRKTEGALKNVHGIICCGANYLKLLDL